MSARKIIGVSLLFLMVMVSSAYSSDTYASVASFFAEYDLGLEAMTKRAIKVSSLSATEKMFVEEVEQYDCASYFFRTNSKGKIIAKVTPDGVEPRNFRYIGKQKWFQIIALSNKPYYGYTKSRSSYFLFWNKPIPVAGNGRFGGSISVKIDLAKSFKKIAEDEGVSFQVNLGNSILFSNLTSSSTDLVEKPLFIGGLPVLSISYSSNSEAVTQNNTAVKDEVKDVVAAAITASAVVKKSAVEENVVEEKEVVAKKSKKEIKAEKKKAAKEQKEQAKKDKKAKSKAEKQAKKDAKKEEGKKDEVKEDVAKTETPKSSGGSSIWGTLLILLILGGAIGGVVVLVKIKKEKERKLLEEIDKM
jgi:hypothetical protein